MLSNAYFLAKFRFDTAENEPAKNLQNFAKFAKVRAGADAACVGDQHATRVAELFRDRPDRDGDRGEFHRLGGVPLHHEEAAAVQLRGPELS